MRIGRLGRTCVLAICGLSAAACGRHTEEPEGRAQPLPSAELVPTAPAAAPPAAPAAKAERHLAWTDPQGFTRSPQTSPMRLATYRVPRASGDPEDGELAVFHFGGGQGGDVEANLARWEKQFSDTKESDVVRSERTVNGLRAHLVQVARGTYTAMMPGQNASPKSGYAMVAAVVESPLGSYFVKLTGPAKTVKANQGAYFALLDSVHVEG